MKENLQEIFDQDGHLTDYAWQILLDKQENQSLDDLQRLEISEHLAYCDDCINKYSDLLNQDLPEITPTSFVTQTMAKIKRKSAMILMNKYLSLAVAASFTIILWTSGVFSWEALNSGNQVCVDFLQKADHISQQTKETSLNINKNLYDFLHNNK